MTDITRLGPGSPRERIRAGWSRFGDLYDQLLELALDDEAADDSTLSSLVGHLIGTIQYAGLQLHADPARPVLINAQFGPWSWGHANPDTLYLSARVDDTHDYRVHGRFGTVAETTLGIYTGSSDQSTSVKIRAADLQVASDGSFEVYFSRKRQGKNWLPIPKGARSFGSYQTYGDWDEQKKGHICIECLTPPSQPEPQTLDEVLGSFDACLEQARNLFTMWARDIPQRMFSNLPVNSAIAPLQPPAAMAGAWFVPIPWRLDPGEALVIDYVLPNDHSYSGMCLSNHWGQMVDIDTRQTSLNLAQSLVDNSTVRVLLSTEDVGVHNWLDARGQHHGLVTWRLSCPSTPDTPTVTKMPLREALSLFSREERVSRQDRSAALAKRLCHFAERNTP